MVSEICKSSNFSKRKIHSAPCRYTVKAEGLFVIGINSFREDKLISHRKLLNKTSLMY